MEPHTEKRIAPFAATQIFSTFFKGEARRCVFARRQNSPLKKEKKMQYSDLRGKVIIPQSDRKDNLYFP